MIKVEHVRCLKMAVFNMQLNMEFREPPYAGFQPFMNAFSPLEGQIYYTLDIYSSVRTSQYTGCFHQKAQSVNAV